VENHARINSFVNAINAALTLQDFRMNFMDQFAKKRESVKPIYKESPNIFYWVLAALEVVAAGTVIVALLYAIFPFKFL